LCHGVADLLRNLRLGYPKRRFAFVEICGPLRGVALCAPCLLMIS
jgi:hypothetical protein